MLTKKDICIVIATYNRPQDVKQTLHALVVNKNIPGKVLVVDQSKDTKTKEVVHSYQKKLPVTYLHNAQPSSSMAKNRGIREAKHAFKLIMILDDDVDLLPGFLDKALQEFNLHPEIKALGGVDISQKIHKSSKGIKSFFFKLCFLPHQEEQKYRIIGPYGNTASPLVKKRIADAEWLPGFNMLFRSEVFIGYTMPESKGYNVLEDIDASYSIFIKHGPGSLLITPACKAVHRFSGTARYTERKRIFVNHEDHFYFYYTYLHTPLNSFKLFWSLSAILLGTLARALITCSRQEWRVFAYNAGAITYCIRNRKKIQKGILREFLDADLQMVI